MTPDPMPPLPADTVGTRQRLLKLADLVSSVTAAGATLAAVLLLALTALVFYNAIGRYGFGSSPVWLQELEWHLLAPVALLGVTVLMAERGHVRVDMLYERMPRRLQLAIDCGSMLCGCIIAILFVRYSIGFVDSAWSIKESSPDPGGLPGRYWLKSLLPVGFTLLALQCLANALRDFLELTAPASNTTPS